MITWSYIAGFLDGDGWICKYHLKSGRPVYVAGMTQVESQKIEMGKIHEFLTLQGVHSAFTSRKKNNWKSSLKMVNVVVKEQKSLLQFLLKIQKHLLIKRESSNEAIHYLKRRLKTRQLKSCQSQQTKVNWSKAEHNKLERYVILGMSNIEISHKLNRSTQSVATQISRLKLRIDTCKNV